MRWRGLLLAAAAIAVALPSVALRQCRTSRTTGSMDTLVDVAAVADYLTVTPGWVYEHANELGAGRIPSTA